MSASPPLEGLRVIEFGEWIAAPYAGKSLADLGADVTKVEWGDGDPTRRWGPFPRGHEGDPERSAFFAYLNTSKRGVSVAATSSPEDLEELAHRAVAAADVVLLDQWFLARLPDGVVERLSDHAPNAIVLTITPFGLDGPRSGYRSYDLVCAASSGTAYGVGERDRPPLPIPLSQGEHQAGLVAAIAAVMALQARVRDGRGQQVDVAITEALASLHTAFFLPMFIYGGGIVGRRNGREGGLPTYPNTVLPCKDGLIALNSPQVAQWIRFVELMGNPEWTTLPRYRDRRAMAWEYKDEVDALVVEFLQHHTKAELYQEFIDRRIPCAPIMNGADLLANEHLRERGTIVDIELPGGGTCRAPSGPYLFGRSRAVSSRAPRLGEHELSQQPPRGTASPGDDADLRPPLAGLRVIDLGTAWAGGLAGRFLGDFGADVVKVESWTFMDGSRKGRPIVHGDAASGDAGQWPDLQPGFHVHGRSKRSVALNLKTAGGRGLLLRLLAEADVLLHNFPAGVMERFGLAPDELVERFPRLVVAGQCVAGYTGPARNYIGYAGAVAALSGIGSVVGYEGEEPIGMFQGLHSDVISALTTVYATMAALAERASSGCGQTVQVSQWEASMAMAAEVVMHADLRGEELGPVGLGHPLLAPHGTYPCAHVDGEDEASAWLAVAVGSDEEWQGLCGLLGAAGDGLPESAASWTAAERREHRQAVDAALAAWTSRRDRYEAERTLQERGVPASAVQSVADVLGDEQLQHRGAFVELDHPVVGVEPMPGVPWHLRRTPGSVTRPAPNLGEHTCDVLAGELSLDRSEIERFVADGAVEIGPHTSP